MWMPRGRLPGCSKKSLNTMQKSAAGGTPRFFALRGRNVFAFRKAGTSCADSHLPQRAEGFQRATGKPFGRARRRETLCACKQIRSNPLSATGRARRSKATRPPICRIIKLLISLVRKGSHKPGGRRFPKGDRKALWSRPQARNPLRLQTDTIQSFVSNRTGAPQ